MPIFTFPHRKQDMVFSVKLHLGLRPYPWTLDPCSLTLDKSICQILVQSPFCKILVRILVVLLVVVTGVKQSQLLVLRLSLQFDNTQKDNEVYFFLLGYTYLLPFPALTCFDINFYDLTCPE